MYAGGSLVAGGGGFFQTRVLYRHVYQESTSAEAKCYAVCSLVRSLANVLRPS